MRLISWFMGDIQPVKGDNSVFMGELAMVKGDIILFMGERLFLWAEMTAYGR